MTVREQIEQIGVLNQGLLRELEAQIVTKLAEIDRAVQQRPKLLRLLQDVRDYLGEGPETEVPLPVAGAEALPPDAATQGAETDGHALAVAERWAVKGSMPWRPAVLRVLQEAAPRALHSREIVTRAEALGAKTIERDKLSAADSACRSLRSRMKLPVVSLGGRRWRWDGPPIEELPGGDASR